jgi:hypothetical protein
MAQTSQSSTGSGDNIARDKIEMNGNVFVIGGVNYTPNISTPTGTIEHLQQALHQNRESVDEDIARLRQLVSRGYLLDNPEVVAVVKDAISGMKNIEYLIPNIRLNGGKANSLPDEVNIVRRLNNAIAQGIQDFENSKKPVSTNSEMPVGIQIGYAVISLAVGYYYYTEHGLFWAIVFGIFWPLILALMLIWWVLKTGWNAIFG